MKALFILPFFFIIFVVMLMLPQFMPTYFTGRELNIIWFAILFGGIAVLVGGIWGTKG